MAAGADLILLSYVAEAVYDLLEHFENYCSHRDDIVAAVFSRQAFLFHVLGMAVKNRRHISGHTISENALGAGLEP